MDGREKTFSEREVVERERRAYERAFDDLAPLFRHLEGKCLCEKWTQHIPVVWWNCNAREDGIAEKFPLPKVTRARVVKDSYNDKRECRLVDGEFETRVWPSRDWVKANKWNGDGQHAVAPTPERCKVWASLVESPTEEVEQES
jgi:hypothetical protein